MPKLPPSVYAPELVAQAIVRASVHPRREIPVGDAALGFNAGQRLSPALTDAVLSVTGRQLQTTDRLDDGTDILDTPMPPPGRVRGAFADKAITTGPVTRWSGRSCGPASRSSARSSDVPRPEAPSRVLP